MNIATGSKTTTVMSVFMDVTALIDSIGRTDTRGLNNSKPVKKREKKGNRLLMGFLLGSVD